VATSGTKQSEVWYLASDEEPLTTSVKQSLLGNPNGIRISQFI